MDVKELMLGDLVKVGNRSVIIENIQADGINMEMRFGEYDWQIDCDDIETIPLTKDFFIKNGFRESEIEAGVYNFPIEYKGLTDFGYAVETDNGLSFYVTDHQLMKFNCVNKFQQVLRLCGLNELADNLEI